MQNKYTGIGVILIILLGSIFLLDRFQNQSEREEMVFSTKTDGLQEAQSMETVSLKNGDMFDLTAEIVKKEIDGNEVKMLAYNGSIPGPFIKVPQGAEITVNFTNNTDVETTLHSHGVRVANEFDGIPGITQEPIPVGGSFTYKLKFPDSGLYWYHPHIREDYAQELGLYGNFFVEPTDSSYWPHVNNEVPLVLDDILLEGGTIAAFDEHGANYALMGRFGNTMLINGETNFDMRAKSGEVVRFFVTNTANTRTFKLSIPGATIKQIGSDGGAYEQESFVESVVVAPSERATLDVLFPSGGTYELRHTTPLRTYNLGNVFVDASIAEPSYVDRFNVAGAHSATKKEIDPLRPLFFNEPDKMLSIGIDMGAMNMMEGHGGHVMFRDLLGGDAKAQTDEHAGHMMPDGSMMSGPMMSAVLPIEWEDTMGVMNSISSSETIQWKFVDGFTSKENADIDWRFKVGDKVKIQIINSTTSMHPMQHPIHLHGQRFLVVSTNGVPNNNLVWKDTALVQTGDTVDLLVDMTNPGDWMLHCHIAEHLESGMMLSFTVVP